MESKIFYLEKNQNNKSDVYTLITPRYDKLVDIRPILCHLSEWEEKFYKIYNPQQDCYISLEKICKEKYLVPREYLQLNITMIKYYSQQYKSDSQQIQSEQNKKQRSRQRSIKDVVQLVQRWRDMHTPCPNSEGKKLNLQEAAKIIGISKKSLDDYFFQLRMGQKYGFDFKKYFDCKIGMLRTFVKQKQIQQKNNGKTKYKKHPKKLKLIQQFTKKLTLKQQNDSQQNEIEQANSIVQDQKQKLEDSFNLRKLVDQEQLFWGSPFSPIQDKQFINCQNNFFKDFENLMDDGHDPFVSFANFSKTSKSIFSDDNNSSQNYGF